APDRTVEAEEVRVWDSDAVVVTGHHRHAHRLHVSRPGGVAGRVGRKAVLKPGRAKVANGVDTEGLLRREEEFGQIRRALCPVEAAANAQPVVDPPVAQRLEGIAGAGGA